MTIYDKGCYSYSRVRGRIEWIKTPDGRTIENPRGLHDSKVHVPKHALLWGLGVSLVVLVVGYFGYQREAVKAASWEQAEATVIHTKPIEATESGKNRHSGGKQVRYQSIYRFTVRAGNIVEVSGPAESSPAAVGSQRFVYYDPQNPMRYSFSAPNPKVVFILTAVFALLSLGFGVAGHVHGPENKRTVEINGERWIWIDGKLVEGPGA